MTLQQKNKQKNAKKPESMLKIELVIPYMSIITLNLNINVLN